MSVGNHTPGPGNHDTRNNKKNFLSRVKAKAEAKLGPKAVDWIKGKKKLKPNKEVGHDSTKQPVAKKDITIEPVEDDFYILPPTDQEKESLDDSSIAPQAPTLPLTESEEFTKSVEKYRSKQGVFETLAGAIIRKKTYSPEKEKQLKEELEKLKESEKSTKKLKSQLKKEKKEESKKEKETEKNKAKLENKIEELERLKKHLPNKKEQESTKKSGKLEKKIEKKKKGIEEKKAKLSTTIESQDQRKKTIKELEDQISISAFEEEENRKLVDSKKQELKAEEITFRFFYKYFTSLRSLKKCLKKGVKNPKFEAITKLTLPRLEIPSSNGPIVITNLNLDLKAPAFKVDDKGKWKPIFGINSLKATMEIPAEGEKPLQLSLQSQNLNCSIDSAWADHLHEYIESESKLGAFWGFTKILKNLPKIEPKSVTIEGDTASIKLTDSHAKTLARLIEAPAKTLGSAINDLFEKLNFPFSLSLNRVSVESSGDLSMHATVKQPQITYTPAPQNPLNTKQKRSLSFGANHVHLNVERGSHLADKLLVELPRRDPFDVLPTGSHKKSANKPPKPKPFDASKTSKSLDLTINQVKRLSISREVQFTAKTKSWALTGNNGIGADIEEIKLNHSGIVNGEVNLQGVKTYGEAKLQGVEINSHIEQGTISLEATKDTLPTPPDKEPLVIEGKIRTDFEKFSCRARGSDIENLAAQAEIGLLTAKNPDDIHVKLGDTQAKAQQGLELTVEGRLIHIENSELSIDPKVEIKGASNIEIIHKDDKIPVPISINSGKARPHIKLSLNKPKETNKITTGIIRPDGSLTLNNLNIGSLRVNDLHIGSDKNSEQDVRVDADLNITKILETALKANNTLPWHQKLGLKVLSKTLLSNKTLKINYKAEIKDGKLKIDSLRSAKIRLENQERAGFFGKLSTKVLNYIIYHFWTATKIGKRTIEDDQQESEYKVKQPYIEFPIPFYTLSIPLKIDEKLIDESNNTIDISEAVKKVTHLSSNNSKELNESIQKLETSKSYEEIIVAMRYLAKEAQKGHATAIRELKKAMDRSHDLPMVPEYVRLFHAGITFSKEKTFKDFLEAMHCLEAIPMEPPIYNDVINLLQQRVQNACHISHKEDEKVFNKTQKELKHYLEGKLKPKGNEAYELALKLLYGAQGASFRTKHIAHARTLLASLRDSHTLNDGYKKHLPLHLAVAEKVSIAG